MSQNKKTAAEKQAEIRSRVASAWTLAKTQLPDAPPAVQYKYAHGLLSNSTRTLTAALKQTAVNAHYTKLAEQFKDVFKKDMNDLLEAPKVHQEEISKVLSEFKGKPTTANTKSADDRSSAAGPQPAKYKDDGRKEPEPMQGEHAAERPDLLIDPDKIDNHKAAKKSTKATAKKAHGDDCEGCDNCKTASTECEDGCTDSCEHGKMASFKAAAAKAATHGDDCECKACNTTKKAAHKKDCDCAFCEKKGKKDKKKNKKDKKAADEHEHDEAADEAADIEENAEETEDEAEDLEEHEESDEVEEAPEETEETDEEAPEGEEFDPAKAKLEEGISDIKADIEQLEEAIAAFDGEPEDMTMTEEMGEEPGVFDGVEGEEGLEDGSDLEGLDGEEGLEGENPEGEELNLQDIFNEDGMEDKVASLNNEDDHTADLEISFDFGPSDAADLEHELDESSENEYNPGSMFSMQGALNDPLASLFRTASNDDVVEWGQFQNKFKTDAVGADDRTNESDHEEDLLSEVLGMQKQPTRNDHRDKETEPHMKAPGLNAAPGKSASPRKLMPAAASKSAVKKQAGFDGNLAGLLFVDDSDYLS